MSCHCWDHCTGERVRHFSGSATPEVCTQACLDRPGTLHDYFCSSLVNSTSDCVAGQASLPNSNYFEPDPNFPGYRRVKQEVIDRPDLYPFFINHWGIGRVRCCLPSGCTFVPSVNCFGVGGIVHSLSFTPSSDYHNARQYIIGPSLFGDNTPLCSDTPVGSLAVCSETGCCCRIQFPDLGSDDSFCYDVKKEDPQTPVLGGPNSGIEIDINGDGIRDFIPCGGSHVIVTTTGTTTTVLVLIGNTAVLFYDLEGDRVPLGTGRFRDPRGIPVVTCTPSPTGRPCDVGGQSGGSCWDLPDNCPLDDVPGRCREAVFRLGHRPSSVPASEREDTELVRVFPQCQRNFYGKLGFPLYYGQRQDAFGVACIGRDENFFENQREAVVSEADGNGDFAFRFSYLEASA